MADSGPGELTAQSLRTKASGRDDRRHFNQAGHKYLYARMLAQLPANRAWFLSNFGDKSTRLAAQSDPEENARPAGFSGLLPLTCYNQRFPMADILSLSRASLQPCREVTAAQVVTQPYDKITPAMQEHYYAASPLQPRPDYPGSARSQATIPQTTYTHGRPLLAANGANRGFSSRIPRLRSTLTRRRFTAPSGKTV